MNNEFEQAFNCLIKHNYKSSYDIFEGLYFTNRDNSSYLSGCIISLLLLCNEETLYKFIEKEKAYPKYKNFLFIILKIINEFKNSGVAISQQTTIFSILSLCIKELLHNKLDEYTDIFIRTARILRPNDASLYRYMAEIAFKNGSLEKGCSLLIKASNAWAEKLS
jgi:hypothetical protein